MFPIRRRDFAPGRMLLDGVLLAMLAEFRGAFLSVSAQPVHIAVFALAGMLAAEALLPPALKSFATAATGLVATYAILAGILFVTTFAAALWLGFAGSGLVIIFRLLQTRAEIVWGKSFFEPLRWIALMALCLWTLRGLLSARAFGAGDAYWYAAVLADFAAQIHAGQFPVWVGQSVYAFNGAVFPLRFAPMFQHLGGLLDLATFHTLSVTALKNATLATVTVASAGGAYFCLRKILPQRPWLAVALAALWHLGPGQLAPILIGDQYMTHMTLLFVPPFCYGLWRLWAMDDTKARTIIAIALGGLWLSHTPVALWCSAVAAGFVIAHALRCRNWAHQLRGAASMAVAFALFGTWPIVSVKALHAVSNLALEGRLALDEIRHAFPANFLPIDLSREALTSYQLGYAVIGLFIATLVLTFRHTGRDARPFVVGALLVTPFVIPVPAITAWIWLHLPRAFVAINNIWPMQRLFLVWGTMIVFGFAAAVAPQRGSRLSRPVLILCLLVALGWSGHEADKLVARSIDTRNTLAATQTADAEHNAEIVRYSYEGIGQVPGYASHGYADPLFENRLFDRATGNLLAANADKAAPLAADLDGNPVPLDRTVQLGRLVAINDNNSRFYNLVPKLKLAPGEKYALRLEFLQPNMTGVLQLMGPNLFREYLLPDSGVGLPDRQTPQSFGALPTSSRVLSLFSGSQSEIQPRQIYIANKKGADEFPFARFWLYRFSPRDLTVVVDSWIPYRARLETLRPAWLETPRIWLDGWHARVNGQQREIVRSRENLVMIPVEPGENHVELYFQPRWWVRISYWCTLISWLALAAFGAVWLLRTSQPPRHSV